ncbi:hypothetical protein [Vibrio maritimus]|uniref:hypothetical protein n=1 Tax=Vibrio maritimus TaxID=990268 RepID=UPI0037356E2E
MANIGSIDIYINVPNLPREEFEKYSTKLFDEWESYVSTNLELGDFSLALEVEEGSIKAKGKIVAALSVLYLGISQYGSFVSGLQTIHNQVRTVGNYLGERASTPFGLETPKPKVRKRGESLARLEKLFVKVERGEMTVEIAMAEAEAFLGSELNEVPEFRTELEKSLKETPVLCEQMELPLTDVNGDEIIIECIQTTKPRKPLPSPKLPQPVLDQFRVEVWRETKRGKRNVKITSL